MYLVRFYISIKDRAPPIGIFAELISINISLGEARL